MEHGLQEQQKENLVQRWIKFLEKTYSLAIKNEVLRIKRHNELQLLYVDVGVIRGNKIAWTRLVGHLNSITKEIIRKKFPGQARCKNTQGKGWLESI